MTNPTTRDLLERALEALEYHTQQTRPIQKTEHAILAIRAELAKQKLDPAGSELPINRAEQEDLLSTGQVSATAPEQCWCDEQGMGEPGVSCGDCPTRDYQPPTTAPVMNINSSQIAQLARFACAGDALDEPTEICIQSKPAGKDTDGEDSPAGLYAWLAEYAEEGMLFLDPDTPTPAWHDAPEVAALKSEIERLRKDAERLDYIEESGNFGVTRYRSGPGGPVLIEAEDGKKDISKSASSLRDAIDSVIKEAK